MVPSRCAAPRSVALAAGTVLGAMLLAGCTAATQPTATEPTVSAGADAGCAAPTASVEPERLRAGEGFTVQGVGWQPCLDAVVVDETGETTVPGDTGSWSVTIAWVQGDERLELGTLEPTSGAFELELIAPAAASAGPATVELTSRDYAPGLELPVSVDE